MGVTGVSLAHHPKPAALPHQKWAGNHQDHSHHVMHGRMLRASWALRASVQPSAAWLAASQWGASTSRISGTPESDQGGPGLPKQGKGGSLVLQGHANPCPKRQSSLRAVLLHFLLQANGSVSHCRHAGEAIALMSAPQCVWRGRNTKPQSLQAES